MTRTWVPRPRIWFGAPPVGAGSATVHRPVDDGPDPDRAEVARRAAAKPVGVRPEESPQAGQYERRVPVPQPSGIAADCPGCAGRDRVIRQLEAERAQLRKQLAPHELAATREQQLQPSEQLP